MLAFKRASSTVVGRLGGLGAAATSGAPPHYFFSHPPTLRVRESERESDEAMPRLVRIPWVALVEGEIEGARSLAW